MQESCKKLQGDPQKLPPEGISWALRMGSREMKGSTNRVLDLPWAISAHTTILSQDAQMEDWGWAL